MKHLGITHTLADEEVKGVRWTLLRVHVTEDPDTEASAVDLRSASDNPALRFVDLRSASDNLALRFESRRGEELARAVVFVTRDQAEALRRGLTAILRPPPAEPPPPPPKSLLDEAGEAVRVGHLVTVDSEGDVACSHCGVRPSGTGWSSVCTALPPPTV